MGAGRAVEPVPSRLDVHSCRSVDFGVLTGAVGKERGWQTRLRAEARRR
jgi:hypothetical protein